MKITKLGSYRNRLGQRVEVTHIMDGDWPWAGYYSVECMGITASWSENGIYRADMNESEYDIIAYWTNPSLPAPLPLMLFPPAPPLPLSQPLKSAAIMQGDFLRSALDQLERIMFAITNGDVAVALSLSHLLHENAKARFYSITNAL